MLIIYISILSKNFLRIKQFTTNIKTILYLDFHSCWHNHWSEWERVGTDWGDDNSRDVRVDHGGPSCHCVGCASCRGRDDETWKEKPAPIRESVVITIQLLAGKNDNYSFVMLWPLLNFPIVSSNCMHFNDIYVTQAVGLHLFWFLLENITRAFFLILNKYVYIGMKKSKPFISFKLIQLNLCRDSIFNVFNDIHTAWTHHPLVL